MGGAERGSSKGKGRGGAEQVRDGIGLGRAGQKCYNKITHCNNDAAKEDNDIMS